MGTSLLTRHGVYMVRALQRYAAPLDPQYISKSQLADGYRLSRIHGRNGFRSRTLTVWAEHLDE